MKTPKPVRMVTGLIAGVGVVVSLAGTFLVRTKEGGNPAHALDRGRPAAAQEDRAGR